MAGMVHFRSSWQPIATFLIQCRGKIVQTDALTGPAGGRWAGGGRAIGAFCRALHLTDALRPDMLAGMNARACTRRYRHNEGQLLAGR